MEIAESIGVASGTDALVLAMLGVGIDAGDEVITVSHTAGPTVAAVLMASAIPVLVDVEPTSYCIDPEQDESADRTAHRAISPVHLYGHPANLEAIAGIARRHGLAVIEGCAQAQGAALHGRPIGAFGEMAVQLYATKGLGAIGDGGAVVTGEAGLADRLRKLRNYGWSKPQYAALERGRCSRLDDNPGRNSVPQTQILAPQPEARRNAAGQNAYCTRRIAA